MFTPQVGSTRAQSRLGSYSERVLVFQRTLSRLTRSSRSFQRDEQLQSGAMRIDCSHDDFTTVDAGQPFEVTVSYSRAIEGESSSRHSRSPSPLCTPRRLAD